jgi:hypothetical protein
VYLHPHVGGQLASERQRDRLVRAQGQRRVRQLVALARESRRAERAERRMRQALRRALRLSSGLEQ